MSQSTASASIPLLGGVSCAVFIERDANGREIVVKQALPKLKVVADWHADPKRSSVEVRALRVMRELLGERVVPEVLWEDAANHRFAMERIDARLRNWKSDLMAGRVDIVTAHRVGELLGQLHTRSTARPECASEFAKTDYFEQLRIEPFFTRVAERNPVLTSGIAAAIAALRAPGEALVHGDYSPKNLLVDGADVVILDCEVAHWGNPRFDIAFCLSHLMLKGLRDGAHSAPYADASREFIAGYRTSASTAVFDASLVRILGCLLWARFEGASPIDYRDQLDAAKVKNIASEMIVRPVSSVAAAIDAAIA